MKRKKPDSKKDEDSSNGLNLMLRWEWENGKMWNIFPDSVQDHLSEKLKKKQSVIIEMAGVKHEILFDNFIMKNKSTNFEKRIRASVVNKDEISVWRFLVGRCHHYFKPADSLKLELMHQKGDADEEEISVDYSGCACNVDFKNMKLIKDEKKSYGITRIISDAVPTPQSSKSTSNDCIILEEDKDDEDVKPAKKSKTSKTGANDLKKPSKSSNAKVKVEVKIEEDTSKQTKTGANDLKKPSKSSNAKVKVEVKVEEDTSKQIKKVVLKGRAPVDPECTEMLTKAHVYDDGFDVYDVMLNQTNINNNNNKFYIIQLLEDDTSRSSYSVWMRWGRVGVRGQSSLAQFGPDLDRAQDCFCKKFYDKTKNEWYERSTFHKVNGKYDIVHIDYKGEEKQVKKEVAKPIPTKIPESKLHPKLQDLIKLICDIKEMEDAVMEMQYDAKKAPLGQLTKKQINNGFSSLKKIDQLISDNILGGPLVEACNAYYTQIPHCFGMKRPPLINTKVHLLKEMNLLEALGEIEIALKLFEGSERDLLLNPIDSRYNSLKCDLSVLDSQDPNYKLIDTYLQNTHGQTHQQYKMKIVDIFCLNRSGEDKKFKDIGNKMLLWHGSRMTNMVGILSQGLRIAPPEAPSSGYMFGKGIYFADMSSKSANYCCTSRSKNTGFLILSQVSLGNLNELYDADYDAPAHLPTGKQSVKGLGRIKPNPDGHIVWEDETLVPTGKPYEDEVKDEDNNNSSSSSNPKTRGKKSGNAKMRQAYSLIYNEYIVYDPTQVKMRFLVQVKFQYR